MNKIKEILTKKNNPSLYWEDKLRALFFELEDMKNEAKKAIKEAIDNAKNEAMFKELDLAKNIAKKTTDEELASLKTDVTEKANMIINSVKEKTESAMAKLGNDVSSASDYMNKMIDASCDKMMIEMKASCDAMLNEMKSEVEQLRGPAGVNGTDGKDADPAVILPMVLSKIEKENPNQIVEKINKATEKIQPDAVLGLIRELQEIKQAIRTKTRDGGGGGSGGGGMGLPKHESFSCNGVLTSFTLAHKVAANGTAVFGVRYQGQTLDIDSQYTISDRTLALTFTPDNGTTVSISYIRG